MTETKYSSKEAITALSIGLDVLTEIYRNIYHVDGEVHLLMPHENKNFEIENIIELNDSKQGRFYIANVKRKEVKP